MIYKYTYPGARRYKFFLIVKVDYAASTGRYGSLVVCELLESYSYT